MGSEGQKKSNPNSAYFSTSESIHFADCGGNLDDLVNSEVFMIGKEKAESFIWIISPQENCPLVPRGFQRIL